MFFFNRICKNMRAKLDEENKKARPNLNQTTTNIMKILNSINYKKPKIKFLIQIINFFFNLILSKLLYIYCSTIPLWIHVPAMLPWSHAILYWLAVTQTSFTGRHFSIYFQNSAPLGSVYVLKSDILKVDFFARSKLNLFLNCERKCTKNTWKVT